jgi:serine phosphatase RsbU (regulator of sigma subunit)
MARGKSSDLRLSGQRLASAFAFKMSIAIGVVMLFAGLFLYSRVAGLAEEIQEHAFVEAVANQGPLLEQLAEDQRRELLGLTPDPTRPRLESAVPRKGTDVLLFADGTVKRHEVLYGRGGIQSGYMYQYKDVMPPLVVPARAKEQARHGLLGLVLGVTVAVILAGAFVAWLVGGAVSRPLELIVDDIAQISRGNLRHRTRVRAGGEIMLLAKSIDRMAGNLEQAQHAELELSRREREIALAGEVREALIPAGTPRVPGCDLGALQVESPTPGGDFHDFIELDGGRIGLLVCEVAGRGIPAAMIAAIARSYLRIELARGDDVAAAFARVNIELARDMRRGMFVTALYALVDPANGRATVACAGHKQPLVRYAASDKRIRLVHPEGIALGFDAGPVFQRTLQVVQVAFEPGDRLVLSNTGPVRVVDAAGAELGDKELYRTLQAGAGRPTAELLEAVEARLRAHAGEAPFPADITLVSITRSA